jgi:hypothetical protein
VRRPGRIGDRLMPKKQKQPDPSVAISGHMDRHVAEALRLELRRLAKRHGVDIKEVRIERPDD